jgi:hypothetical protein
VRLGLPTLLPLLLLSGCAGRATSVGQHEPPLRAPAADADEWDSASWEQRHDTMTWLVLPTMARKFQAFAGSRYPELSCFACHGADAEQVAYRMPHGLPALDPANLPNAQSHDAREARYAAFMTNEVTPTMRELLGKPDLSCMTCHPAVGGS